MRIAVIGAGLSGLVAVKELRVAGHDVHCFERGGDLAGVFSGATTYDSVRLTVSNYFMAYSDFMPYGEPIVFWTRAQYKEYLDRYADRFRLREAIQFHTTVTGVKRSRGGFVVTVQREQTVTTETFDRLVICSGQFQKPNIPKIPGLESFPGRIIHSAEYKNPASVEGLRNKRVLCFGMGESAADVVAEVSELASHTVLSLRRYQMFATRCAGNLPIDVAQHRSWHATPVNEKAMLVRFAWRAQVQSGTEPWQRLLGQHVLCAAEEPGSVVTKTERIFQAQAAHNLRIDVGGVRSIDGSTVTFTSGKREDFDGIVFCTGFEFWLPFLEEADQFKDIRECYLQMFHPRLDNLAFVGFVRPQQGGIPLMAELQARYLALVWSGQRKLPDEIESLAAADAQKWKNEFFATPHVFALVNGLRYNERLAELIGCRPPVPNPALAFDDYLRYWFHHIWPCQYRLVGPGANHEAKRWIEAPSIHSREYQLHILKKMLLTRARSLLPINERDKWRPLA